MSSVHLTHEEIAGHVNKIILKAFGADFLGYSDNQKEIAYRFSELEGAKLPSLLAEGADRLSILSMDMGDFKRISLKPAKKTAQMDAL